MMLALQESKTVRKIISVFKTSVKTRKDIEQFKQFLDKISLRGEWNFDLEDCDNILRIESENDISQIVIDKLNEKGFDCEELQ